MGTFAISAMHSRAAEDHALLAPIPAPRHLVSRALYKLGRAPALAAFTEKRAIWAVLIVCRSYSKQGHETSVEYYSMYYLREYYSMSNLIESCVMVQVMQSEHGERLYLVGINQPPKSTPPSNPR